MFGGRAFHGFLASQVGRNFLVFLGLCAAMALGIGVGVYHLELYSFRVNKGEEKVTALELVDAFFKTYSDVRTKELTDTAPVPASLRAHAIERFNAGRDPNSALRLQLVGPPGRAIETPPSDDDMVQTIERFAAAADPVPETRFVTINDTLLFRTVYPSVARQESCVTCHNQHQPGLNWRLGEVMGAYVIDVPAGPVMRRSTGDALVIGLAVFTLSGGIGLFTFSMQYREFRRRELSEASLRKANQEIGSLNEDLERRNQQFAQARDAAQAASRAKSEFLANMSHELRTPLNAVIGFSEMIAGQILGPMGDPRYAAYAADIHGSGQHLLGMINDILDLAKIEAGHLALAESEVDLARLVDASTRMVVPQVERAGLALMTQLDSGIQAVRGDHQRLLQVLLNLLGNAVKFTPQGGRVAVLVGLAPDGGLTIAIEDTGIGIAESDLERVMEPFVQADGGLNRRRDGTGLGLALSRRLVELHGGKLRLKSRLGAGTTATVTLPPERVLGRSPRLIGDERVAEHA